MRNDLKIRFLDLSINDQELDHLLEITESVYKSGQLVMGEKVESFEQEIAHYCGRNFSTAMGSGTDALFFAIKACGLGIDDEIITSSLSWIATANAIAMNNSVPVFADIQDDLNICPLSVERLITPKTKAIVAVDYTGKLANYTELLSICQKHNLILIEDGSQAFGSYKNGIRCGAYGLVSAISHNPMKVFAATGEAGSVLTDDPSIKETLDILRYNGTVNKEYLKFPSLNGRMDSLQAAILSFRLRSLDKKLEKRIVNAQHYKSLLKDNPNIWLPAETDSDEQQVYYTFTIKVTDRDGLLAWLADHKIECKIQHPILMCDQTPFSHCSRESTKASKIVQSIISIPVHEKLSYDDINFVADTINKFYN